jgi:hypothetical protein
MMRGERLRRVVCSAARDVPFGVESRPQSRCWIDGWRELPELSDRFAVSNPIVCFGTYFAILERTGRDHERIASLLAAAEEKCKHSAPKNAGAKRNGSFGSPPSTPITNLMEYNNEPNNKSRNCGENHART